MAMTISVSVAKLKRNSTTKGGKHRDMSFAPLSEGETCPSSALTNEVRTEPNLVITTFEHHELALLVDELRRVRFGRF